jgi:predicted DNA-binding transcriptional regulator AlpA
MVSRLVGEDELSALLGLPVALIKSDRKTNRILPFIKFGGDVYYNPEACFAALMASNISESLKEDDKELSENITVSLAKELSTLKKMSPSARTNVVAPPRFERISEVGLPFNMSIDRVIYRQDLYRAMGVTSETLRRWLKEGKIPPADVQLSVRTVGWRLSTLHAAGIKLL